ncbi:MAG: hypothetical protein ACOC3I_10960 [Verrucomicrobiota bacterium]
MMTRFAAPSRPERPPWREEGRPPEAPLSARGADSAERKKTLRGPPLVRDREEVWATAERFRTAALVDKFSDLYGFAPVGSTACRFREPAGGVSLSFLE